MKTMWMLSLAAALSTSILHAATEPSLKVGDNAPEVTGKDENGRDWSLTRTLETNAVLLYFYPKDNTPGCTKEACGFRDNIASLKAQNVVVIGVSFDAGESHRNFIQQHQLNFPLLADTDGKIADAFGVRKQAGANIARRVSFLIGRDRRIKHITDNPNADTHLAEMKEAVAKLPSR